MKTGEHHRIAREGYPIIAAVVLGTAALWFVHPIAFGAGVAGCLFTFYFFRNPRRTVSAAAGSVVAPADGKVIDITEVDEGRFLNQRVKRVSIFMSPWDVHVNRVPVGGTITRVSYNKGKFFPAFEEKASLANEQNAVIMKNEKGASILFVQIAGWLARRIVCHAREGEVWNQGAIYGLIRFGSRMEVYVPLSYQINVSLNQKVKAGESVLAKEA
ncbi:MAG: phosphatidylserine decarboxylase family protein [Deltaproteobacteria bacterium]|nr:phosphatidylserine decarboxylase family protein [Deltaproteobacteria bacterium]